MVIDDTKTRLTLNQDELSALRDISLSLHAPKLKVRYAFLAYAICVHALVLGVIAIVSPDWFIDTLISPSIQDTESLLRNTRIRGVVMCLLVPLWAHNMYNQIWSTRILNAAIVWVLMMSVLDFLKVFYFGVFEASASTALFTIWRPILVVALYVLKERMKVYFRAVNLNS